MNKIDINCDLGESFGAYTLGRDESVIRHVSSVNIACGYHAGDPLVMQKTIALAKARGVAIGAHPSFPDLMGFGRRELRATPDEIYCYCLYQLGALDGFARAQGQALQHMKAHGALYNMAGRELQVAEAMCRAMRDFDKNLILLALAGSKMAEAAKAMGVRCALEFFADRAYLPDGNLAPRNQAGAIIHDTSLALARVVRVAREHKVAAIDGTDINVFCHSICIHGDNENALDFACAIQSRLEQENIEIAPFGTFI